jgi:predicted  nucleic acid-binding Zn-ribbon protein
VAQIQFLNGSRDGETQDLIEEASLSLGAQDGQFINVKDAGVEPEHALIYSVKGQFYVMAQASAPNAAVFVNFKKIGATAAAVSDRDIVMFGRTLAKFWSKQAPSGGSGGGGPAVIAGGDARMSRERDEARARVSELEAKLAQAQSSGASAASGAQSALDQAKREKDDLSKQLDSKKKELDASSKEKESLSKEVATLKREKKEAEGKRDDLDRELKQVKDDRDDVKKSEEKVRGDLDSEKKRAQDLEHELEETRPKVAEKEKELDALRKALDALKALDLLAKRDRRAALREGSDLAKALAALGVPDTLRDRIATAVRDEVDREVLSREGPVVPVRGLRCPACDADLETELTRLKSRRQALEALRATSVQDLSPDDVTGLVEKLQAASGARGA